MDEKPKVARSTRSGEYKGWRWEAEVDKWEGGRYAIDSIIAWDQNGEPVPRYSPREASHDTLEQLDLEAEMFVRGFLK